MTTAHEEASRGLLCEVNDVILLFDISTWLGTRGRHASLLLSTHSLMYLMKYGYEGENYSYL